MIIIPDTSNNQGNDDLSKEGVQVVNNSHNDSKDTMMSMSNGSELWDFKERTINDKNTNTVGNKNNQMHEKTYTTGNSSSNS